MICERYTKKGFVHANVVLIYRLENKLDVTFSCSKYFNGNLLSVKKKKTHRMHTIASI